MKLSKDFITYNISGENVLVGLDREIFSGVVKLNDTAAFLVEQLAEEKSQDQLVAALMDKYEDVDEAAAGKAIEYVLAQLSPIGAIEQ